MKSICCFLIAVLSVAAWCPGSYAQVPEPPPVVFGSGGGSSNAGGVYLTDTVGQPVIGIGTGTHRVRAGFWYLTDPLNLGPVTAVLFSSFGATVSNRGVELNWLIASAEGLRGYNVYRSPESLTGYTRLNDHELLPVDETSFVDDDIRPGQTYWYRVGAIDDDGEFLSLAQSVTIQPRELELLQNYPNPFNPSTHIDFYLPNATPVTLVVYDVQGRRVATLVSEQARFGYHSITWDGTDQHGERVSSGVYFYRLTVGNRVMTKKLVVLK